MQSPNEQDLARIAWCDLDLGISQKLIDQAGAEIAALAKDRWYYCTYRACNLLLVYGGKIIDERHELNWLVSESECPSVREIVESKIRPLFHRMPRVIVLHTPSGQRLRPHIDCAANEVGTFQPKLRIILKGRLEGLYFLGSKNQKVKVNPISPVYYMSGAFTHSLDNESELDRYTLCFGNPWTFKDMSDDFLRLLSEGIQRARITSDDIGEFPHAKYAKDIRVEKLTPLGEKLDSGT